MKKRLALILAAAMCVTCLFTGCGNGNAQGTGSESEKSTEKGSESSSSQKVDIKDLYKKGEYEGTDLSQYLTLGDYTGIITLKESDYAVSKEEIQAEVDGYRESYGTAQKVTDRAVQKGDIVNINYVGRIYGIKFLGGSAEKYDLTIGSGSFIDGFEDALIGAKTGDTVEVKVTFPTDYKNDPELAGKEAVFTVTINSISVTVPAEYNDAFVKKVTESAYSTIAEFEAHIENQLLLEKKAAVLDKFLVELEKKSTFTDKVDSLVTKKYEEMVSYYTEYAKAYGYTLATFATAMGFSSEEVFLDTIKNDAQIEVKMPLLIYAYGNAVGFTVTDAQVLEVAENLTELYGLENVEAFLAKYDAAAVRAEAYNELLSDYVINAYK